MDFTANIIPGTNGASGTKPNRAEAPAKSGGDENSPFASLVSKTQPEETPDAPETGNGLPVGHVPGEEGQGENTNNGVADSSDETSGLKAFLLLEGEERVGASLIGADGQGHGDASLIGMGGEGGLGNGQQGAGQGPGLAVGQVDSALVRSETPNIGLSVLKSGLSAQGGQPGGILETSQLGSVLNRNITARPHEAKFALEKPGVAGKADAALKAAPDPDPAKSTLAVFPKINAVTGGKAFSDLVAAKLNITDGVKTPETGLPTVSVDGSVNIPADKSQGFQSLLQGHLGDSKSGALPVNAVAVEISRKFSAGANRFQIRLDPPELGRIDVRMDVNREGKVSAHLIVEKPETLAALNRDAGALVRALNTSGLETRENGLNFSLSGGNHSFDGNENPSGFGSNGDPDITAVRDVETLGSEAILRGYVRSGGVDIHV